MSEILNEILQSKFYTLSKKQRLGLLNYPESPNREDDHFFIINQIFNENLKLSEMRKIYESNFFKSLNNLEKANVFTFLRDVKSARKCLERFKTEQGVILEFTGVKGKHKFLENIENVFFAVDVRTKGFNSKKLQYESSKIIFEGFDAQPLSLLCILILFAEIEILRLEEKDEVYLKEKIEAIIDRVQFNHKFDLLIMKENLELSSRGEEDRLCLINDDLLCLKEIKELEFEKSFLKDSLSTVSKNSLVNETGDRNNIRMIPFNNIPSLNTDTSDIHQKTIYERHIRAINAVSDPEKNQRIIESQSGSVACSRGFDFENNQQSAKSQLISRHIDQNTNKNNHLVEKNDILHENLQSTILRSEQAPIKETRSPQKLCTLCKYAKENVFKKYPQIFKNFKQDSCLIYVLNHIFPSKNNTFSKIYEQHLYYYKSIYNKDCYNYYENALYAKKFKIQEFLFLSPILLYEKQLRNLASLFFRNHLYQSALKIYEEIGFTEDIVKCHIGLNNTAECCKSTKKLIENLKESIKNAEKRSKLTSVKKDENGSNETFLIQDRHEPNIKRDKEQLSGSFLIKKSQSSFVENEMGSVLDQKIHKSIRDRSIEKNPQSKIESKSEFEFHMNIDPPLKETDCTSMENTTFTTDNNLITHPKMKEKSLLTEKYSALNDPSTVNKLDIQNKIIIETQSNQSFIHEQDRTNFQVYNQLQKIKEIHDMSFTKTNNQEYEAIHYKVKLSDAYLLLASLCNDTKYFELAIETLDYYETRRQACLYYLNKKMFEKALEHCDRVLEYNLSPNFLFLKGSILYEMNNFAEAIRFYKKHLIYNHRNQKALSNLALCYFNAGNAKACLDYLERAILEFPERHLLMLYEKIGYQFEYDERVDKFMKRHRVFHKKKN